MRVVDPGVDDGDGRAGAPVAEVAPDLRRPDVRHAHVEQCVRLPIGDDPAHIGIGLQRRHRLGQQAGGEAVQHHTVLVPDHRARRGGAESARGPVLVLERHDPLPRPSALRAAGRTGGACSPCHRRRRRGELDDHTIRRRPLAGGAIAHDRSGRAGQREAGCPDRHTHRAALQRPDRSAHRLVLLARVKWLERTKIEACAL